MLRDYQEEIAVKACKLLQDHRIAYLSMMVRTGKTFTALATAEKYKAYNVLFVTKKKAIGSIEDDYKSGGFDFLLHVTNYEQLNNYEGDPDLVIIDEAHSLGQYPIPSERVKLLKKICEGKPIIYLSGTPTPEGYSQVFHQFFISSFSPFKDNKSFYAGANAGYVTITKKKYGSQLFNDYSKANKKMIDEKTEHLFLNFSQDEAGFTQEIEEEFLLVRMKPATYTLANKLITNRIFTGKNGEVVLADTGVKLQNKLHQVYSGTVILESEQHHSIVFDQSKVSFIAQYFEGKKIAIFYKFKAEEIMIKGHYPGAKTESPEEFRDNDNLTFISQIQSGREGVNLATADAIVFLNIDFSALSYFQARARLQDKDRTKPAKVYWIFSENGLELKIYERVKEKKDFTNSYFLKSYGITYTDKNKEPADQARLVSG